ncbi:nuclear transport factor 2 family protein [Nocardia sp. NBC_00508]|uniref:nuclear transport factor 2 family protein n=1 Tax=Nocardia sp. NBC_00508 TaxID=2975992 RepID=UPI002E80592D|nr:nuclear transport factor 2 family protein [Nocardia sp. NBC_00508]WUD66995.1 nuclear transport factor 2 family protein [Nocardia sp. NBC_00508]
MTLSMEDRIAINDLIAQHGHLVDAGELDRMDELFSPGIVYDLSDLGFGELRGIAAVREAALMLGDANPVGHHVTNVLVTETETGEVQVRSKGIGISADGGCASVTYEDVVVREEAGWRISSRKVVPRRAPLGG